MTKITMNLDRYYVNLKNSLLLPKQIILKSDKHKKWIQGRPCVVTKQCGVDAHHMQRKAQGLNDYTCIPLNHKLHIGHFHQKGWAHFEETFKIDLKDALIATLIERIIELEGKS